MRKLFAGIVAFCLLTVFAFASSNQVITHEQGKAPPAATCFNLQDVDHSAAVMPIAVGYGWDIPVCAIVPEVCFATLQGEHKAYLADMVKPPDSKCTFWQAAHNNKSDSKERARNWVISINLENDLTLIFYKSGRLTDSNKTYVAGLFKNTDVTSCSPPFY